jgi:molybdopterin-containing oxidoreductase family membrane subunit
LAKLLATVIIIDLFFLFAEIITTVWPASQTPGHFDRLMLLLAGKYAPLFIPEITVFGILPFFLLAIPKTRKSRPIMAVSCGLVVIGIFIKRFILLAMAFGISQIGPLANRYVPTLLELMVTLGWYALGTLIVTLAVKLLPMEVPEEEPEMVEEPGLREAEVLVEPK